MDVTDLGGSTSVQTPYTGFFDPSGFTLSGVSPTVELPIGNYTFQLVVNNGFVNSQPSSVQINVIDGTIVEYQTNPDGSTSITTYYTNGDRKQSWTKPDGSHGENDKLANGSTLNNTFNPDGSSVTYTYTASTGVYSYNVVNADKSWKNTTTTYDAIGGFKETWTASDGSSGENDKLDDGTIINIQKNPDGSSTNNTYYTDGGSKRIWTNSDGSGGENDKFANGSTFWRQTNLDGSYVTIAYNATTGITTITVGKSDGSSKVYISG